MAAVVCSLFATLPAPIALWAGTVPPPVIRGIERARAPFFFNRIVVFTYRPRGAARFVALRFEHENYGVLHPYRVNENNVFVFTYEPPEHLKKLTYRISVDGLWMADPANPSYTTDLLGRRYSVVSLEKVRERTLISPRVSSSGTVELWFRGGVGQTVRAVGNFNQWDTFSPALEEIRPGLYTMELRLIPGDYYYYFLVDGRRMSDPLNPRGGEDPDGLPISSFHLDAAASSGPAAGRRVATGQDPAGENAGAPRAPAP